MESIQKQINPSKFQNPEVTAKGEVRAWVSPTQLDTLWFNTGTLCNLECENCYIESSPKNDRLSYISLKDVEQYLNEIDELSFQTKEIAFTGGEPFLNKEIIEIINLCLERNYETLILSNATLPLQKKKNELLSLKKQFNNKLKIRVSLDHYLESRHAEERGPKAWRPAIEGLKWLSDNSFYISIAGRTLWEETEESMREGFKHLFENENINIDAYDPLQLILFPEMDLDIDVPEITTACWNILNKSPKDIMCVNSRMVVKRKGQDRASVAACTLLPYDSQFDLGLSLKESWKDIKLNHPHCAKFCVLGGGSCSK